MNFPASALKDVSRSPAAYRWSVCGTKSHFQYYLFLYHLKLNQIRFSALFAFISEDDNMHKQRIKQ